MARYCGADHPLTVTSDGISSPSCMIIDMDVYAFCIWVAVAIIHDLYVPFIIRGDFMTLAAQRARQNMPSIVSLRGYDGGSGERCDDGGDYFFHTTHILRKRNATLAGKD